MLSNATEAFRHDFGLARAASPPALETLNIFKASIPLDPLMPKRARIWLWHINELDVNVRMGIVCHLSNGTGHVNIINVRQHVPAPNTPAGGDLSVQAVCLAKRMIANDLDNVNVPLQLDATERSYNAWSWTLTPTQLLGGVIEFDIVPIGIEEGCSLNVRIFATRHNTAVGTWATRMWLHPEAKPPETLPKSVELLQWEYDFSNGSNHIRGWWPYCGYEAWASSDITNPFDPSANSGYTYKHYSVIPTNNEHVGPNGLYRGGRGEDPYGTKGGNKGLYGVDIAYTIGVSNPGEVPNDMYTFVTARNTAPTPQRGKFWGAAVQGVNPVSQGDSVGLLKMHYGGRKNAIQASLESFKATWRRYSILNRWTVPATAPNVLYGYVVRFMIGSASDLPASLVVSKTNPINYADLPSSNPGTPGTPGSL